MTDHCRRERVHDARDAHGTAKPLMHPKHTMKIGSWRVRILYGNENITTDIASKGIHSMDISETNCTEPLEASLLVKT